MKIFYRVFMVERGRDIPLQVISVGMIREDGGDSLYLINEECLSNVFRHPWLSMQVWPYLPARVEPGAPSPDAGAVISWDKEHEDYGRVMALDSLGTQVLQFIRATEDFAQEPVELWSHHGAFDHVALTQIFGNRGERPAGVPDFTCELGQILQHLPVQLPLVSSQQSTAIMDAIWIREVHDLIAAGQATQWPDDATVTHAQQLIEELDADPYPSPKELTS